MSSYGNDHTQPITDDTNRVRLTDKPWVSAVKKRVIRDIHREHPEWDADQIISQAQREGVELTRLEVKTTLDRK
jgi:hypothetical protein